MTDLERLNEALAHFLAREPEVPFDLHDSLRSIIDAARVLANGQRVEVCETHGHFPVAGSANCLFKEWGDGVGTPERCRLVFKLLSVYPKEAENVAVLDKEGT